MWTSTSRRSLVNTSRSLIRFNSTKPTNDNSKTSTPEFNLSDIFKRIDQVTVKANEIKKQNQEKRKFQRANKHQNNQQQDQSRPPRTNFNNGSQFKSNRLQSQSQSSNQQNNRQRQTFSRPFRGSSDQQGQGQQQQQQQYSKPFRPQSQEDGTTNFFRNQSKNRTNREFNNDQQSSSSSSSNSQSTNSTKYHQKNGESNNFQYQKQNDQQQQRQFGEKNSSFERFSTTSYTPKLFESIGTRFPNNERRYNNAGRSKPWQNRGQDFRNSDNKSGTTTSAGSGQKSFKRPGRQQSRGQQQKSQPPKNTIAQPIESKELIADSLKPQLNGDKFFHGKIPSILSTIDSRIASITKLSLLDSKYPFNLPKDIINQSSSVKNQNKFILQNNWNLNPNSEILKERINKLVYGKIESINTDDKSPENKQLIHNIEINPTLSQNDKQSMYNTITDLNNIKSIFKDAHWKQVSK
ncbi:uncharacterized protein KGF55_000854 [Candida pseudojiufengensis]|uniref:uncharacterized protein n=1 Tax=Candida pseudojiufengensis TaxID=497109 RepID=UPI0022259D87|nr:uncharacterized protein KGF55_000854 [Candida pseudojiufengensis]KAI5966545.1 hypothetical protein KGF55_000854 [Candida pseudojiufengensis]